MQEGRHDKYLTARKVANLPRRRIWQINKFRHVSKRLSRWKHEIIPRIKTSYRNLIAATVDAASVSALSQTGLPKRAQTRH